MKTTNPTNRILAVLGAAFALAGAASANNIQVSNVTLSDLDTVAHTVNVKFDVSWENSWRVTEAPANWDAAWLFVKFHTGDLLWRHASLDTNDANHTAPAGGTIEVGLTGARGAGVFLYRSTPGTGIVNFANVKLKWHYGDDAVPDTARVSVDATAIEMVYIPDGAFYVGDGNTAATRRGDSTGGPFQITSAGPIAVGTQAGKLSYWSSSNSQVLSSGTAYLDVPTTFPNGFTAFYCMKYEPSQGERAAAANKSGPPVDASTTRQTWTYAGSAVSSTSPERASVAGTYSASLTYSLAYLDWAGLRPMTELEYEKACRGPSTSVVGEYAWGSPAIAGAAYTIANDGTSSENVASGYRTDAGNAWTPTTRTAFGPCRVGMFALQSYTGSASPRIQSGATYYGVMDMTGNVSEAAVAWPFSSAASPGFIFTEEHGDGTISANAHDVPAWGSGGQIASSSTNSCLAKGGSYSSLTYGGLSNVGPLSSFSSGHPCTFRGVRTAP